MVLLLIGAAAFADEPLRVISGPAMAAMVLATRHEELVVVEHPRRVPGIDTFVCTTSEGPDEWPRHRPISFTYDGTVADALPKVASSWREAGGPGDFRVVRIGVVWHLIPTTEHDSEGRVVPIAPSILDHTVALPTDTGTATDLFRLVLDGLVAKAGPVVNPVVGRRVGVLRELDGEGMVDGTITLQRSTATVRELLDDILVQSGALTWSLSPPTLAEPGVWYIRFLNPDPSIETQINNLTPRGLPDRPMPELLFREPPVGAPIQPCDAIRNPKAWKH